MRTSFTTLMIITTIFSLSIGIQKVIAMYIIEGKFELSKTDWKPLDFNDFLSELDTHDKECISFSNNEPTIRALLIGAHKYELSGFPLAGPPNDIELIKYALETRGVLIENIQVRKNGEAVRKTVIGDFSRLLSESRCGDEILLYLNGQALKGPITGYVGERLLVDNPEIMPELKKLIVHEKLIEQEKEQNYFLFEDYKILTSTELQNFIQALRIKGINIVVVMDMMFASEFSIETTSDLWKCCSFIEQTPSSGTVKGHLTVFYSPSLPYEFTKDGKSYSSFSLWVGTTFAQSELVKISDIAKNIYENYLAAHVSKMILTREKLSFMSSFVLPTFASTSLPDQLILNVHNKKKNLNEIDITLTLPTDKKMRAIPILPSKKQKITGQISLSAGLIAVVVAGKPANLRNDGRFTVELPLKRGDNQIRVVAIYDNRPYYEEQIIVHSDAGQYEVMQSPRTFAILIGNQNYSEKSGFTELETPHRDIEALEQILTEQYGMQTFIEESNGNKRSLVIRDASRRDIFDVFSDISKVASKDDSVLIFYAGHGNEKEFMEGVRTAYWIPANSEIEYGTSDWVSADDLNKQIAGIQARHVLVIADSCYSGVLAETRDKMELVMDNENRDRYLSEMSRKKSRYLVSSGGDEPVSDSGGDGHSIFARMLLTALENPPASIFTMEQIFHSHLKQKVANKSLQIPQMNIIRNTGHEDGNFVFFSRDSDFH